MTTANKALNQPAYNSPSWDAPLNSNFGYIDAALGSTATISNTSNYTLVTSEYQCMRLYINGSLASPLTLSIPSGVGGFWFVIDATTDVSPSAPTYVTVKSTAGGSTGIVLPRYVNTIIFSNGSEVYFAQQNNVLAGTIIQFAGSLAPYGYVSCEGQALSRSYFATLFAAIGTTWGAGNGTTTFNIPDLRGMFLRGTGTNATGSSAGAAGPAVGGYAADTYLNHSHTITDPGHAHSASGGASAGALVSVGGSTGTAFNYGSGTGVFYYNTTTGASNTNIAVNNSTTGGTETKPKNYGILYCIKY